MEFRRVTTILASLAFILMTAALSWGIPPSPEAIEKWKAEGVLEEKLAQWRQVDRADSYLQGQALWQDSKRRSNLATADAVDTGYVVVALVDFDDNVHTEQAWEFDSLLFSVKGVGPYTNPTGSWTDFYLENSYGKYFVKGIVSGWHRMPKPYSYYVGDDDGGAKSGELAVTAAYATDADVDYSELVNGGSFLGFIVVHAGPGAEDRKYGIWSHKGNFSGPVSMDGVSLYGYTMNPEKYAGGISTMGVFAHEYGHTLGLPDLYDTDYQPEGSSGLGSWSLMAGGSWNGLARGGDTPSHFDAWCKWVLGYANVTILSWNTPNVFSPPVAMLQAEIPQVESEPVIYKLVNDSTETYGEYFLVENRQKVGFDAALPGHGLCIYHVDIWQNGNDIPGLYEVGLVQADGKDALGRGGSGSEGDAGDPFPGSTNNRNLTDITTPNTRTHTGVQTKVGVWNISDSDSLMYADLEAGFTHPWPVFYTESPIQFIDTINGGNGNGVLDPGETIEFWCRLTNTMASSFDPMVKLTCDYPGVTFQNTWVLLGTSQVFSPLRDYWENAEPIKFTIPEGIDPINVTFTLRMVSDTVFDGQAQSNYVYTWELERVLGQPKILLIDNDGGQDYDLTYRQAINDLGFAWGRWDRTTDGAPSANNLNPYEIVIYMTGYPTTAGSLTIDDAYAFSGYLYNGGHLALVSCNAASQLNALSPGFLNDYMHANLAGTGAFGYNVDGVLGSGLGDNLSFEYDGAFSFSGSHEKLAVVAPAMAALNIKFFNTVVGVGATAYSGPSYKAIMMTTPLEFFNANQSGKNTPTDMLERIIFFFDGTITDVAEENSDGLPSSFSLQQNYPNPFNPTTQISYTVPAGEKGSLVETRLEIFNILGQEVKTLVDKPQATGDYTITWDGRDNAGEKLATGVYLYRLTVGSQLDTKKMILLK